MVGYEKQARDAKELVFSLDGVITAKKNRHAEVAWTQHAHDQRSRTHEHVYLLQRSR